MLSTGFSAFFHPFAIKEKQETKYKTFPFDCQKPSSHRDRGRAEVPPRMSPESSGFRVSEQEPIPKGNSAPLTDCSPRVGLGWNAEPSGWSQASVTPVGKGREQGHQGSTAGSAGQLPGDELRLLMSGVDLIQGFIHSPS